eukprot:Awhi_evm1s6989
MSAESAGKLGSVGSSFLSVQPTGSGGNSGLGGSSSPHFGGEREKNSKSSEDELKPIGLFIRDFILYHVI